MLRFLTVLLSALALLVVTPKSAQAQRLDGGVEKIVGKTQLVPTGGVEKRYGSAQLVRTGGGGVEKILSTVVPRIVGYQLKCRVDRFDGDRLIDSIPAGAVTVQTLAGIVDMPSQGKFSFKFVNEKSELESINGKILQQYNSINYQFSGTVYVQESQTLIPFENSGRGAFTASYKYAGTERRVICE